MAHNAMHIALCSKHVAHVCSCNCSTAGLALNQNALFAFGSAHKNCFERRLDVSKACGASRRTWWFGRRKHGLWEPLYKAWASEEVHSFTHFLRIPTSALLIYVSKSAFLKISEPCGDGNFWIWHLDWSLVCLNWKTLAQFRWTETLTELNWTKLKLNCPV